MQRYLPPPPQPDGFDGQMESPRRLLSDAIAAWQRAVDAGQAPKPIRIKSCWGRYKDELKQVQHGKCGYCDSSVTAVAHGDVEHYRPKSAVSTLGDEKVWRPGYWWAAFRWENYLFACQICNQRWKRNLFPVEDEAGRQLPPTETSQPEETPLLLNPFYGPHPYEHLRFRPDGMVEPLGDSKYGQSTIRVCGLNRDELRQKRRENAQKAWELVRELVEAQGPGLDRALRGFYQLGQEEREYSGMVQAIFEQNTGVPWSQLKSFVENSASHCSARGSATEPSRTAQL